MYKADLRLALLESTRKAETSKLSPFFETLSSDRLSREYDPCEWAIGPFEKIERLTYRKTAQWPDPWEIGWDGRAIHNASLIEHEGKLYMFYRCNPSMESLSGRIGLAVYSEGEGWTDCEENPILYSTMDNENLSCEDPKIYRADGGFYLFYEAVFSPTQDERRLYAGKQFPVGEVGAEINWAESSDLVHWQKRGPVLPREMAQLWAKGGVIAKDGAGYAQKIDGKYMMFVSEGCGGRQVVGTSGDMRSWEFRYEQYLDTSSLGSLFEVASCVTESPQSDRLVMDFFYDDGSGITRAGEALYNKSEPTMQIALNRGGTLNVGGLIRFGGRWIHAQGWDAAHGIPEIYVYGTVRR